MAMHRFFPGFALISFTLFLSSNLYGAEENFIKWVYPISISPDANDALKQSAKKLKKDLGVQIGLLETNVRIGCDLRLTIEKNPTNPGFLFEIHRETAVLKATDINQLNQGIKILLKQSKVADNGERLIPTGVLTNYKIIKLE